MPFWGRLASSTKITAPYQNILRHYSQRATRMPVPTTQQVIPGASVSIVLKADQRTGRQVQGKVGELLTRGNHPRGIKVRLADGRVGRVQRMLSDQPSPSASVGPHEEAVSDLGMQVRQEGAGTQRMKYRDVRLDEDLAEPPAQHDLAMYIKPARGQKKKRGKANESTEIAEGLANTEANGTSQTADFSSTLTKCPVCGDFEGDEAAITHHVEQHFTEAPCG